MNCGEQNTYHLLADAVGNESNEMVLDVDEVGRPELKSWDWATREDWTFMDYATCGKWTAGSNKRLCKVLCEDNGRCIVLNFKRVAGGTAVESRRLEYELRKFCGAKEINKKLIREACEDIRLKRLNIGNYIEDVSRAELGIIDKETLTRHGIPLPLPLRYAEGSDLIGYLLMLLVAAILCYTPVWTFHRDFTIPLVPGAKLDLSMRDCDLWFTEAHGEAPAHVRVRYWNLFGKADVLPDEDRVHANVTMWAKQNWEYLACSVYVFLPPDYAFKELRIATQHTLRSALASDAPLRADEIHMVVKNTWVSLEKGIVSPKADILSKIGVLNMDLPDAENLKLSLRSEATPVFITSQASLKVKGNKDVMLLKASHIEQGGDSFVLGAGEPHHELNITSDASVTVTVSKGASASESHRQHAEDSSASEWHGQHTEEEEARRLSKQPPFVGSEHKYLHLGSKTAEALKDLPRWLNQEPNTPWVVQMQAVHPDLPQGIWTIAVTGSYMAMPLEYYSLLSFGRLTPRIRRIDVDLFGVHTLEHLSKEDVQKNMYRQLIDLVEGAPEAMLSSETLHQNKITAERKYTAHDFKVLEHNMGRLFFCHEDGSMDVFTTPSVGAKNVVEVEEFQLALHARLFATAWLLNGIASIILAVTLFYLMQMSWPVFIRRFQMEQFNLSLTHRLQDYRVEKVRSWRLIVMMRHSPSHGILLRWAKRPRMSEFRRLVFFVQARRPKQHQIRLSVDAKDVPCNRFFPDQREYFISADPLPGETRDALKVSYGYRAKVVAFDKHCNRLEESIWSSPIVMDPPRPFAETPMLLLKHFFPASHVYSSFDMFIKRHLILPRDVELCLELQLVRMQNITPQLIPDNYYVEILLGTIKRTFDPRVYARTPLFRLKQRKTMPEMEFAGQLRLKEEGSCMKDLEFSTAPYGEKTLPPKEDDTVQEKPENASCPGAEFPVALNGGLPDGWWKPEEGYSQQHARFTKVRTSMIEPHRFMLRNHPRVRFQVVNNSDGKVVAKGFRVVQRLLQEDWDTNQPQDGTPRDKIVQTSVSLRKTGSEEEEGHHFARIVFNFALPDPDAPASSGYPKKMLFKGDVCNCVWQEGAERILTWKPEVAAENFRSERKEARKEKDTKDMRIRITLFGWPGIEDVSKCFKQDPLELEDVVSDVALTTGSYSWIVSTAGEPATTPFFQLQMFGFKKGDPTNAVQLGRTCPMLVNRTLTLASLEMAYCAFCRLHGLKMEYMSPGPHGLLAMKDVNIGPKLVQLSDNCRGPFPFEPQAWAMRSYMSSEGATMVTTSVARDPALIGQVRTAQIVISHRLDPSNDYWIKEPLLSNDLDYSYLLTEWIIAALGPVLNPIHSILERVMRSYDFITLNKVTRFFFRRWFAKRLCEVCMFGMQLLFFAFPVCLLTMVMLALTQQKAQFDPFIRPHPSQVLRVMDKFAELFYSLDSVSQMGYICCLGLLVFFAFTMCFFGVFGIKMSDPHYMPLRFSIGIPGPYLVLDGVLKFIFCCSWILLLIYIVCCFLWFVLGSVVTPSNLPIGIFVIAAIDIGRRLTSQLLTMRKKLKAIMSELIDDCLRLLLNAFFSNHKDAMRNRMFAKDVKKHVKRVLQKGKMKNMTSGPSDASAAGTLPEAKAGDLFEMREQCIQECFAGAEKPEGEMTGREKRAREKGADAWFEDLMLRAEEAVEKYSKEMGLSGEEIEDDRLGDVKVAQRDLQTDEVFDFEDKELVLQIQRMFDHSLLSAPSNVHLPQDLLNSAKVVKRIQEYVTRIIDPETGVISGKKLKGYMGTKQLETQDHADETFQATLFKETDMALLTDRLTTFVNERLPEYTRAVTERMLDPSDPESRLNQIRNEFAQKFNVAAGTTKPVDKGGRKETLKRIGTLGLGQDPSDFFDGVSWLADFLAGKDGPGLIRPSQCVFVLREPREGVKERKKVKGLRGPVPLVEWLEAMVREYCWQALECPEKMTLSAVWQIVGKILDGSHLWYGAFEYLVIDKFGIVGTDDEGKERLGARLSASFDQYSRNSGFMDASAVVSAIQKVTNRGVWKSALKSLLSDMELSLSLAGENVSLLEDENSRNSQRIVDTVVEKWWTMYEEKKAAREHLKGFIRRKAVFEILGLIVHPHLQMAEWASQVEKKKEEKKKAGHMEQDLDDEQSGEDADLEVSKEDLQGIEREALWQEAYRHMLQKLEIRITPDTETEVFMQYQKKGYMSKENFKDSINELSKQGMWFTAFQSFLEDSRITLPLKTQRIIYQMADFQEDKVDGVVDCDILARTLRGVMLKQGLWLEAAHVVLKEMSVQVSKEDLKDVFDQENVLLISFKKEDAALEQKVGAESGAKKDEKLLRGFVPYESLLDVANGLGRKGLPLDSFVSLVHELHLSIPDAQLHEIFARMDVNQEFGITWPEFRSGFCLMMKDTLPNNLLDGIGLSERKMTSFVAATVFSLFLMFVFLQLSSATLAQSSAFQTFMQSALTIVVAVAVKVESSVSELSIYKEQVTDLISQQLSLPHSVVLSHLKKKEKPAPSSAQT